MIPMTPPGWHYVTQIAENHCSIESFVKSSGCKKGKGMLIEDLGERVISFPAIHYGQPMGKIIIQCRANVKCSDK